MDTKTQITRRLAFASVGAAALAFLAFGQGSYSAGQPNKFEIAPHPRDFVQIREGTTYTVPVGKIFVLTALGGVDYAGSDYYWFDVDGQNKLYAHSNFSFHTPSLRPVPPGCTVAAGSNIVVRGGASASNDVRAWGYLAEPLPAGFEGKVVRVPYAPHPTDMVQFGQGSFYIVPPGKIFVLTAMGADGNTSNVHLRVNAQLEVTSLTQTNAPTGNPSHSLDVPSFRPIPLGFAIPAGSIAELTSDMGNGGEAWGYLADA